MKKINFLITLLAIALSINSFSQEMTEKEKKTIKKEMLKKAKATDALLLKGMFDNYDNLLKKESELTKANAKIKQLQKQVDAHKHGKPANTSGLENKAKGEAYLKQLELKNGVVKTASGLMYEIVNEGAGAMPTASNTVKVHYEGSFIDGKVFDSSIKRGQPIEFGLGQVIKGWTEGLQLMNRGAKFKLYIPYNLAYGERGRSSIPAYSMLIFDVELIDFK